MRQMALLLTEGDWEFGTLVVLLALAQPGGRPCRPHPPIAPPAQGQSSIFLWL